MSDGAAALAPVHRTISGVEVVTIPLAHYAELLDCQRRLAVAGIPAARYAADPRSRMNVTRRWRPSSPNAWACGC